MKRIFATVGSAAVMLLLVSSRAEASSITVAGSTLGCFGSGCTSFGSPVYSGATYDLTFIGASFSVLTDSAGSATLIPLGTFGRGNTNVSSSTSPLNFTLEVTFTLPTGIGGNPSSFTAVITGTTSGGGGAENVNFNNAFQTFTYSNAFGSGSFEFAVSNDPQVTKNTTTNRIALYGAIQNATFTTALPPTTPVPEPASLLLLGGGLTALAVRFRRRGKSKNDGKRQSVPRT